MAYLWTKNEGITFITDKINVLGFNDKRQIIGTCMLGGGYVLFNTQGHLINLSEAVRKLYPDVNLTGTPQINNKGVVLFQARIWGELHFLLVYPD